MRRVVQAVPIVGVLWLATVGPAAADEVLFLNGDRLTGKIVQAAAGKLKIKTETAGEVLVDLAKVRTFSTDDPIVIRLGDTTVITSKATAGPDGTIAAVTVPGAAPHPVALKDVTQINPPPPKWTGTVSANGLVTTGNSRTTTIGIAADAVRRAERDRIADLDLRLVPSIGLGYQWFEGPTFNLSSEAGLAWIYEDYRHRDSTSHFGARLAYHVDYKPHDVLLLFHNLEWLPSFADPVGDYNLNADAGLRATIVGRLFSEVKVELRHDSTPAPGRDKNDVRYLMAIGYSF